MATFLKFFILILISSSGLGQKQEHNETTAFGLVNIDSDTSFSLSNGNSIYFKFIPKEQYERFKLMKIQTIFKDSLCNDTENYEECKKILSKNRLKKHQDKFERVDDCIILHIDNGTIRSFCDRKCDCPVAVKYQIKDYLSNLNLFWLHVIYYNDDECILINSKTGTLNVIWGEPYPSPDNKKIIAFSYDPTANPYGAKKPNGLQMWRKHNEEIYLEWFFNVSADWGPNEVFWIDKNKIYLKTRPTLYAIKKALHSETRKSTLYKYIEITVGN